MRMLALVALLFALLAGCGAPPASPPQARGPMPPAPPAPPKAPVADAPGSPPVADAPAARPLEPATPPLDPAARPAAAGVGKKGHYDSNPLVAPIAVPISARFRAEEKITFGKITHALQLYKASDPRGRGPQSHDEFMKKIIEPNLITLPELPANEAYQYDPASEQLMVVPKK